MVYALVVMQSISSSTTSKNIGKMYKVHSILVGYFIDMRLNVNGSIFFGKKMKKNDFEEKKVNVRRFGECSFFYIKRPINIESHMYKVTN